MSELRIGNQKPACISDSLAYIDKTDSTYDLIRGDFVLDNFS